MGADQKKKPSPPRERGSLDLTPVDDLGGIADPLEFGLETPSQPSEAFERPMLDLDRAGSDDLGGVADPLEFGKPKKQSAAPALSNEISLDVNTLGERDRTGNIDREDALEVDLAELGSGEALTEIQHEIEAFDDPGGVAAEETIDLEDFGNLEGYTTPVPVPEFAVPTPAPPRPAPPRPATRTGAATDNVRLPSPPTRPPTGATQAPTVNLPEPPRRRDTGGAPPAPGTLGPLPKPAVPPGPPQLNWRDGRWRPTADLAPKGVIRRTKPSGAETAGVVQQEKGREREEEARAAPAARPARPGQPRATSRRMSGLSAAGQTATGKILLATALLSLILAALSVTGTFYMTKEVNGLRASVENEGTVAEADGVKISTLSDKRDEAREAAEKAEARARRLGENAQEAYDRAMGLRAEKRYGESSDLLRDLVDRFPESDLVPQARNAMQENARLDRGPRTDKGGD